MIEADPNQSFKCLADSLRIEVLEEKVTDSTQEEVVKSCKEVDRFESHEALNVNFEKEKLDRGVLFRRILNSKLKEPRMDDVLEEKKIKRLTFKTLYARGLLGRSGRLVNDIENKSGADEAGEKHFEWQINVKAPMQYLVSSSYCLSVCNV